MNEAWYHAQRSLDRVEKLEIQVKEFREEFETLKKQVAKDQKVLEMLRRWKERVRDGMRRAKRARARNTTWVG